MQLIEPASILEVLFQFVFPRRHPNLDGTYFEKLSSLTEAVEKYKVFLAMPICEARLRRVMNAVNARRKDEAYGNCIARNSGYILTHSAENFFHAIKRDYPKMINETALCLSWCSTPLCELFKGFPNRALSPWVSCKYLMSIENLTLSRLEYHECWKSIFRRSFYHINHLSSGSRCSSGKFCTSCRISAIG